MGLAEVVQDAAPEAGGGPAVPGHGAEPLVVVPPDRLPRLGGQLLIASVLDEEPGGGNVPRRVQEDAVRRLAVPPGPARLLVVGLQAFGHVVVDHVADVGLVDAHAEGVGGHHHGFAVELEVVLIPLALLRLQPRVVAGGGHPSGLQRLAHLLHPAAGGAVDDAAAAGPLLHQLQQGGQLAPGVLHVKKEVGPVKAGDLPHRVPQGQQLDDVLLDRSGGGGGKGGHRGAAGQPLQKGGDPQIAGAEVLPPLGDAVGLVHRHQRDLQLPDQTVKALPLQPLRGHIQQLIGPLPGPAVHRAQLLQAQGAVEAGGGRSRRLQGRHLVLHQGDQRGHHQRHPRQQQGRDLVAQGLPPAGGHDAQHVPPVQDGVDEPLLPRTEGAVAEIVPERLLFVHAITTRLGLYASVSAIISQSLEKSNAKLRKNTAKSSDLAVFFPVSAV